MRARSDPAASRLATPRRFELLAAVAIAAITILAFWRVSTCGFVNFDDDLYVTDNVMVKRGLTGEGIAWAFTTFHSFNWHPLTWLSHMLDCQLFGVAPAPHHLMSLLIHVVNAVVLLHVLLLATGARWRSTILAALFAVHPLHVESVAWVAERKDVLSGLFWLLTMWAYVTYARRGGRLAYGLALLCMALGVLAKPMVVTLPFVLLLMDVWPLRRWSGITGTATVARKERAGRARATPQSRSLAALVVEKLPFLACSVVSSVMTFIAQHSGGAVASLGLIPVGERIANAITAYVGYLSKLFWPTGLNILYPFNPDIPVGVTVGAVALLVGLTAVLVVPWRRRPAPAFGWLWYLGTLVPVIGLVQVGSQAMADRYMYIPMIGALIVVVWGGAALVERARVPAPAIATMVCAAAVALALRSHDQIRYWKDSVAMYERSLSTTSYNPEMEKNLGVTYMRLDRTTEAKHYLDLAIRHDPQFADAYYNRGLLLDHLGNPAAAEADYRSAIRLKPDHVDAHELLGVMLFNQGRIADAAEQLAETVRLKPGSAQVRDNYGAALAILGRPADAIVQFRTAIELDPAYAAARQHLERAEAQLQASGSPR